MLVVAGPDHAVVQDDESVARFGSFTVGAYSANHHI